MSHTSQYGPCDELSTTFIHDGGYDGLVQIRRRDSNTRYEGTVIVPMDDLIAFVADAVRARRICALESATAEELLGLTPNPPQGKM